MESNHPSVGLPRPTGFGDLQCDELVSGQEGRDTLDSRDNRSGNDTVNGGDDADSCAGTLETWLAPAEGPA
jgi:hypothetical protein